MAKFILNLTEVNHGFVEVEAECMEKAIGGKNFFKK